MLFYYRVSLICLLCLLPHSDLNGEWWTERCNQYLGECSFTQDIGIDDCESSEYFYVKFEVLVIFI